MTDVTREEFNALNDKVTSLEKANKTGKAPRKKRAPSKYNIYVGDKIKEIKTKNPSLGHTDAFKQAVEAWKQQKPKTDV